MAVLGIDDFKSKLIGGGARANLFQVICNFPAIAQGDVELTSFMCKGAQVPQSILAPIPVNFRGRQIQLAGDRTFEPITLTILNSANYAVRNAFERWSNAMNQHNSNVGLVNPTDYHADLIIQQLDKNGEVTKSYDIRGAWPSTISEIELNFDSENTIEEFTVELQYLYWESDTTS